MDAVATLQMDNALMQARGLGTKPHLTPDATDRRMRQAAEDFEAVFLGQMLQPMFEGLQAEAPFGGGQAEKMWQSMLVDEYGKSLAKGGGIGLADAVYGQLLQAQEAAQTAAQMQGPANNAYKNASAAGGAR